MSAQTASKQSVDSLATDAGSPGSGSKLREASGLVCVAFAIFLLLALASLRLGTTDHGGNWVGSAGEAVGGAVARAFGLVAWLIPAELTLLALPLFRGGPTPKPLRLAGDLVIAALLACLLQIAMPALRVFGGAYPGGQVGLFWGELARSFLSGVGSFLFGGTALALIGIGRSRYTFGDVARLITAGCRRVHLEGRAALTRWLTAWKDARAMRREQAAAAAAAVAEQAVPATHPPDEAILAQLEDGAAELGPFDMTGPPPLALSDQLRQASIPSPVALLSRTETKSESESENANDNASPAPSTGSRPERRKRPRPSKGSSADSDSDRAATSNEPKRQSSDQAAADAAAEPGSGSGSGSEPPKPKIVDTRPAQQVEKAGRADRAPSPTGFKLPKPTLLSTPSDEVVQLSEEKINELAALLKTTLANHKVSCDVVEVSPGPTVTTYEVEPEPGTRVRQVAGLSDDLALGLSRKVRIIAPIPGKNRIGFELPNDKRIPVNLRELVEDRRFAKLAARAPLPVVLGRDIVGKPFYADLSSMPHVIVAGATGAGKSVGLNVMLASLLFHRSPEDLRMLMIDPKVVELAPFDGIPHMLLPVVTDMKQAVTALKWAVDEMERRYQLFANAHTKNMKTYNNWVKRVLAGEIPMPKAKQVSAIGPTGEQLELPAATEGADGEEVPEKLPSIVIVIDEFADLMMQQGKDVEAAVARLAQKARAAGMHVVLATQRPSVDVITGMIKANFPTRIAFRVSQKVDSRTILDEQGAELLLGMGDMLVKLNGSGDTRRVQCPFISEEEVQDLTDHLREQGSPDYNEDILKADEDENGFGSDDDLDARFDEAVQIVADTRRCSTSWLQRKMTIGYNRAAKIVEAMEVRNMVGPPNGSKEREIFLNTQ